MLKTIAAVMRFIEASLLRLSPGSPVQAPRGHIFLFGAARDDGDRDTAPHRPVAFQH
jgi:hypothetical protein